MRTQNSTKRACFSPAVTLSYFEQQKVLSYAALVRRIAFKLISKLPKNIEVEDLMSSGHLGLIDAVKRFDWAHKNEVEFPIYAQFRIRGEMLDELRRLDFLPRSEREKIKRAMHHNLSNPTSISFTVDSILQAQGLDAVELIFQKELKKWIWLTLLQMDKRSRGILVLYYFVEKSLREIGDIFHITESRVSQIHSTVLEKLAKRLREFFRT